MLIQEELEVLRREWAKKKYFTDAELCDLFKVSHDTTARWRKQKLIAFMRTPNGRGIRYLRKHVEEFENRFEQRAKAS